MSQAKILLVEDNPDDVELTVHALRNRRVDNEIVIARDGVEAIELLLGRNGRPPSMPDLPAVVILDLNLPRITGIEVLKRIRSSPRTTLLPVVMLTTSVEDRDVLESYRGGCNAFVQKPVSFDSFLDVAGQLGLFWLVLNVRPPEQAERVPESC